MKNFDIQLLMDSIQKQKANLKTLSDSVNSIEKEVKILDDARVLLETLKTTKIKSKKDFITNIINTALMDIFESDIKLLIKSTDEDDSMVGKTKSIKIKYDIVLEENGVEIGRNEKLLNSNGGGVLSIVSLLLKMLTGYIYSRNKFYIFDESLAQVSVSYQSRLSKFLAEFCDTYGFTIILVNHAPNLSTYADIKYNLHIASFEKNLKVLGIHEMEVREDLDLDTDYFYVDIENFQSMKKLSFKFKGFVSITGNNNIGKSAIMRSINSLIFNTFQDNYPRIGTKKTTIKFGHVEEGNDYWVTMTYASKKISYTFWDGESFTGKRLAYDNIKSKIEKIGFKYLDIGKMYKNWKSDTKDQVDRLYVSTQHDKLYLVGAKSNDSEKIFNFLFNAEAVAQAILSVIYDIREKKSELVSKQNEIEETKQELEKNELLLKLAIIKYKQTLDHDINEAKASLENHKQKIKSIKSNLSHIEELESKINIYVSNIKKISSLSSDQVSMKTLKSTVNFYNNVITQAENLIKNIFEYQVKYKKIEERIVLDNNIQSYKTVKVKTQKGLEYIDKLIRKVLKYKNGVEYLQNHSKKNAIVSANDIYTKAINIVSKMVETLEKHISRYLSIKRYQESQIEYEKNKNIVTTVKEDFHKKLSEIGVKQCECCQGNGVIVS